MAPRTRPSLPLRWHLVRLVLGTLLPVTAFAWGLLFFLARAEREATERRVLTSARSLAESFDSEMAGSLRVPWRHWLPPSGWTRATSSSSAHSARAC